MERQAETVTRDKADMADHLPELRRLVITRLTIRHSS
jgi:hypothetical protein